MNAPMPALVARPERLRLVGQRRQILALMHQRLMFGLLVYAGVVALIVLRILYLAAFGDHAGAKRNITALVPERGDIIDRDGQPLARTIDAWIVGLQPGKVIGNKLDLARKLQLDVVAEGVETVEDWQMLADLGCGMAQGHLISKPVPGAELTAALGRWRRPEH